MRMLACQCFRENWPSVYICLDLGLISYLSSFHLFSFPLAPFSVSFSSFSISSSFISYHTHTLSSFLLSCCCAAHPLFIPISFHPLPIYTNLSYKFFGTLNPCPLFSHFSFLFHYTSPPVLQFHFWYPLSFSRSCFLFHSHSLIMSKTVSLVWSLADGDSSPWALTGRIGFISSARRPDDSRRGLLKVQCSFLRKWMCSDTWRVKMK